MRFFRRNKASGQPKTPVVRVKGGYVLKGFDNMPPISPTDFGLLSKIKSEISMLHVASLLGLFHIARSTQGPILEIGPYIGGSTIALAKGILQSTDASRRLITIDTGGQYVEHPSLPSTDILGDLRRNLALYEVAEMVSVIEGWAHDPSVIESATDGLTRNSIDVFVIDADGATIAENFRSFKPYLSHYCYLVIDDYDLEELKAQYIRPWIQSMLSDCKITEIGLFPWATWFGQTTPRFFE